MPRPRKRPALPFNSLEYAVLLLVCFVVYRAFIRVPAFCTVFLLFTSYVFYGSWNKYYLVLIFAASTIDFFVAPRVAAALTDGGRKRWLMTSIGLHLALLSVFKYFNFFMESVDGLARIGGFEVNVPRSSLILPAGVSFFTFQSMSYTIDVYRGDFKPERNYLRYLLFSSFFPQLVAGPIVRARDLLTTLRERPLASDDEFSRGLFLIVCGLLKKVVIADYLALNLVDRVFDLPHQFSAAEVLLGVYGYALQIYGDFSGYSDIAIGSALLLGFRFPANFNAPYTAVNLQDFWHRWHISLSTWLRDYLYVPLGGNRNGTLATYRNVILTMLLGGLWHGASWTFVIWGALHGGTLAMLRFVQRRGSSAPRPPEGLRRFVAIVVTFHFVCLAWVFFRSRTLDDVVEVFRALSAMTFTLGNVDARVLGVLGLAFVTHFWSRDDLERWVRRFVSLPSFAQAALVLFALQASRQVASAQIVPFIYFQF